MARGGYRPTAPQNNFGVSASGGNGNKGNSPVIRQMTTQAPRYMPGLPQGQGRSTFATQQAAPLAGNPTPVPAMPSAGGGLPTSGPQAVPLSAPTQRPNEPVNAGLNGQPYVSQQNQAQNAGLIQTLNLLDQLGNNASNQVKSIRNALQAHLSNASAVAPSASQGIPGNVAPTPPTQQG